MKKIYEAPKMDVEVVRAEEMLAGSINADSSVKVTDLDKELLGKDRDNGDWGGLW